MKPFNIFDWYWIVAGDETRRYSSATGDYVPADDATFVAWAEDGTMPTIIDTEYNLGLVLGAHAPRCRPIPPGVLDGYADKQAAEIVLSPEFVPLFEHENRLRVIEGVPPIDFGTEEMYAWLTQTIKKTS